MAKYCYRLYGMKIETDLEFLQLVTDDGGEAQIPVVTIEKADVAQSVLMEQKETGKNYVFGEKRSWLSNNTMWMVAENGNHIGYQLKEGGNPFYMQTFLLGYGMSMIALQRGLLPIHCSAVADEKGAVLIAGESGSGKSTLTVSLLEKGYRLMADDMALVEPKAGGITMVYPAFPYQKLCRNVVREKGCDFQNLIYINEEKDKFLVPCEGEFSLKAEKVKAFLMLGIHDGEDVSVSEVRGIDRMYLYADNLFVRHLLKEEKYRPEIGQKCLEMAAAVPSYYLSRPCDGDSTKEILKEAEKCIACSENGQ